MTGGKETTVKPVFYLMTVGHAFVSVDEMRRCMVVFAEKIIYTIGGVNETDDPYINFNDQKYAVGGIYDYPFFAM